jgi:hypothetical protein
MTQHASRIVKPLTAKQRAATQRYSARIIAPSLPPEVTSAARSWWIGCPRDQFTAVAAREQSRIQQSKFGRLHPDFSL